MDPDQIAPLSNNINPDQTAQNGAIEAIISRQVSEKKRSRRQK